MQENTPPRPVKINVSVDNVLQAPRYYVNHVTLQTSTMDFLFACFEIMSIGSGDEKVVHALPVMSMRMSPQHAKALSRILADHVGLYERRHGEIHLDDSEQKTE